MNIQIIAQVFVGISLIVMCAFYLYKEHQLNKADKFLK